MYNIILLWSLCYTIIVISSLYEIMNPFNILWSCYYNRKDKGAVGADKWVAADSSNLVGGTAGTVWSRFAVE